MNKIERDVRNAQRTQAISVLMIFVIILFLLQLWLLTISMEQFLGGENRLAMPTFLASLGCFGINLWLLRYVNGIDAVRGKEENHS